MFLKNKVENKETISILTKEIRRLEKENVKLRMSLDEVKQYKDDYEKLILELRELQKTYKDKLLEIDNIAKKYEKELNNIIKHELE